MHESQASQTTRTRVAAGLWLLVAIVGMHFAGGGLWFFAGICLGWLGAVIASALLP
jgi:hypothetical protein